MITERTLKKWRKEALEVKEIHDRHSKIDGMGALKTMEICGRILRMTQELLDTYLIRKK